MAHRHRVLVVEDDPQSAEALRALLSAQGMETVIAADGEQALAHLQRHADDVCLVLLDLMLPKMDGWEFRLRQTSDPRLVRVPVIAMSGGGDLADKVSGLRVAMYFTKPPDPAALIVAIERLCADRRGASATA